MSFLNRREPTPGIPTSPLKVYRLALASKLSEICGRGRLKMTFEPDRILCTTPNENPLDIGISKRHRYPIFIPSDTWMDKHEASDLGTRPA